MPGLPLELLPHSLTICRLEQTAKFPDWALASEIWSITKTRSETSVVCEARIVPSGVIAYGEWRAFAVAEQLDFNLTGILTSLTKPLAEAGISIFALSTYDTDYLLVQTKDVQQACQTLAAQGHHILGADDEPCA